MERDLLKLIPKRFLCPYCGEWHDWPQDKYCYELEYYDSERYSIELRCSKRYSNYRRVIIYFQNNTCFYQTVSLCNRADFEIKGKIAISMIAENFDEPKVTFDVPFTTSCKVGSNFCYECKAYHERSCQLAKLGEYGDNQHMNIKFGFEFEEFDYQKFAKEASKKRQLEELKKSLQSREEYLNERESNLLKKERDFEQQRQKKECIQKQKNKEETIMSKTSIWEQLYEHSPKENVEIVKNWAQKYKPTLKLAVPVVSIYAAYRILNSKDSNLNIDNIDGECNKKLGVSLEALKDKNALKELMVLGGLSAGAYAAIKAVSAVYDNNAGDVSVEQIEESMDKMETASKKFGWIQPKTEAMLPVAVSVIIVYVMTQKPKWFEKIKNKVNALTGDFSVKTKVYMEMVKLFVLDKLNVDLDNEEEVQKVKKFAFLAGIVAIGVFLYGKKMLGNKANFENEEQTSDKNEKLEAFMTQVISIMEKLMPTAFAGISTFLITKKVLKPNDTVDAECIDVEDAKDGMADVTPSNQEEDEGRAGTETYAENS